MSSRKRKGYSSDRLVIDRLGVQQYRASIVISHKTYRDLLDSALNQIKYAEYWKTGGSWDALGVIESFMNPNFELFKGMEDFCILLERVGLLLLSQADTERVVKTIRKVEPRFASFNEVKESKGARDRAQQEIFLHENKVALEKLPLDELFDAWSQSHLPSLKKNDARYDGKAKSVETFLKKDCTSLKFMET